MRDRRLAQVRRFMWFLLGVAAAAMLAATAATCAQAEAPPKPQRIVSLDLCADQLLIELVEPERIAAVTFMAPVQGLSAIWERAKGLPVTRGAAEDVLSHRPDLILAGQYGSAPTVNLLRRLKANVVVVPMASDLEGVRVAVRAVAAAVGEDARGEAMVAAFDRRLAQIKPPSPASAPTAVVYQV